nr:MAG TPA: hypothetical protein [Caudoviricetes sp.]
MAGAGRGVEKSRVRERGGRSSTEKRLPGPKRRKK